jgi:plastocyanin
VHGGAKQLTLKRGRCRLYTSKPTWGSSKHPFYNVKPVLHEPGPIRMSEFTSAKGFAVRRGEKLRLDSDYDAELLHTRVMGIFILYMANDDRGGGARRCAKPSDLREWRSTARGRTKPPRFKVPIIGLKNGVAREISAPAGRRTRLAGGSEITVADQFFATPNVSLPAGSLLRWRFSGRELHNVTVASGPRGFSSAHMDRGRIYAKRLTTPGTYKLFCGLHPVSMTQTIKVTKR